MPTAAGARRRQRRFWFGPRTSGFRSQRPGCPLAYGAGVRDLGGEFNKYDLLGKLSRGTRKRVLGPTLWGACGSAVIYLGDVDLSFHPDLGVVCGWAFTAPN